MKKFVAYLKKKKRVVLNSIVMSAWTLSPQIAFAAAPTGNGLKTWGMDLGKNIVTVLLLYHVLGSYARQSVGKMAFALVFGAVVLWIVNAPDQAAGVLRQVGELMGQ